MLLISLNDFYFSQPHLLNSDYMLCFLLFALFLCVFLVQSSFCGYGSIFLLYPAVAVVLVQYSCDSKEEIVLRSLIITTEFQ